MRQAPDVLLRSVAIAKHRLKTGRRSDAVTAMEIRVCMRQVSSVRKRPLDDARIRRRDARDVEVFATKRQSSHRAIILATAETVNGPSEFSHVGEKLHREAGVLAFIDAYLRP